MKHLLLAAFLTATALAQSTGDYIFQRKTSSGYAPQSVTPQNGKILSWNSSGQLANIDPPSSLTWESISGKPTTLSGYGISDAVATSQLSTTGGVSKVAQYNSDSYLKTGATNADQGTTPAGGLRIPAQQRITWEGHDGNAVGNIWAFPNHGSDFDANPYPELVQTFPRWCWYWTEGMQFGDAEATGTQRGYRHAYFNPLGKAHAPGTFLSGVLDSQVESISLQFRGSWWTGSEARTSAGALQFIPSGVNTGELAFFIGGQPTASNNQLSPGGTSAYGRMASQGNFSKVFGVTDSGPKIASGKVLTFGDGTTMSTAAAGGTVAVNLGGTGTTTGSLAPTGDWTVTQNSVPVIRSDSSGAITNTIRLTSGFVRVGTSGATGVAAFPFEVRLPGSGDSTAGEAYVDTNGTLNVGRLSATSANSSGRLRVQDRLGTASVDFNAVTSTHAMSGTFNNAALNNFTNTTDSTSSTTGSAKFSGGVGIAKKLYIGTGLNVSTPTVPASASATGTAGDISWDSSYIYICTATNTWKRVAIATW